MASAISAKHYGRSSERLFLCLDSLLFLRHLADTICEVIFLYQDLHELLLHSYTTREYFVNLPVRVQLTAHQMNDEIRTAEQLHRVIDRMTKIHK